MFIQKTAKLQPEKILFHKLLELYRLIFNVIKQTTAVISFTVAMETQTVRSDL